MSDNQTARLALPMLQPGQAQKELYHNEALALIDLSVQATVANVGQNVPATTPQFGESWIVGAAPTGVWASCANHLAGWTTGGWRFVAPFAGMRVWSLADGVEARFAAGSWTLGDTRAARLLIGGTQVVGGQQAAIALPTGGTVIDAEARATINTILVTIRAHGLIAG